MATLLAVVDDEPYTPPVRKIVPHPLHKDEQSVAKADEIHKMDEEPYQPGREATQVDAPQIRYRRRPSDGCHRAPISVAEGLRGLAFQQPSLDLLRGVDALLHSHGCQARQQTSLMLQVRHVAYDKDLRIIGDTEVRGHVHTPAPIQLNPGTLVEHSAQL